MPETYDPNCEETNPEKVVAGHWELLRRNKEFRALSERWLRSHKFRCSHALSSAYYDMQNHTPRCGWDWMLTAAQRVRLAKFQIEKLHWLADSNFNFGPIICHENFSPAALNDKNWKNFLRVEPMPNAPPPISINDSWDRTPAIFKEQFRLAYAKNSEFGDVNSRFYDLANLLRVAAAKLAAGDPLKETPIIANYLFQLGGELHELAEFFKIFKIPKRRYSEQRFKFFLGQIHDSFKTANLLLSTKTYGTHKSYQGTNEDWLWLLEAERLGLDIRKSADLAMLAERYSEKLRQRAMRGQAPPRAKAHGHTGSKFSSKVIKNRRSTVKRHVLAIEKWICAVFPKHAPKSDATAF
jgi:hypothetical protein